jgi:zinc transport system substrate-binding protein
MEGVGNPKLIIPTGASPHEYSLRPSEAKALQDADMVIWMGEGLAPWMESSIETLSKNAEVVTLLEAAETKLLKFREGALFEEHDHDDHDDHDKDHDGHDDHDKDHDDHDDHDKDHDDHDDHDKDHDDHDDHDKDHDDHDDHDKDHAGHDDHDKDHDGHDDHDKDHDDHDDHDKDHNDHDDHAHGDHDPHAWLSIENAQTWLNLVAGKLSAADPENAGLYFANAAAARAEIGELVEEVNSILGPVRGRNFVAFHDAYQYFEMSFDFPASGAISMGDATDPSAARIAEIQGRVRDEGINCVLSEPQFNPNLVATVLSGTDANTGVIDPLGVGLEPGPKLYGDLIRNMAKSLAGCL